jgi:hypothetical protein
MPPPAAEGLAKRQEPRDDPHRIEKLLDFSKRPRLVGARDIP